MQVNRVRKLSYLIVGGIAAATLLSDGATAGVRQSGSLLSVFGQTDSDSMFMIVNGDSGGTNLVTLFGVVGVADGTSFTGVDRIDVFPGGRSDSLDMEINSSNLTVNVRKSTREFTGNLLVTTPAGRDATMTFDFITGTRSDNVKIEMANNAPNLNLTVGYDFGTRESGMSILVENLVDAVADVQVTGNGGTRDDTFEFIGKGLGVFNLNGSPGVETCKVETEGDLGGIANLSCPVKAEVVVKGDLIGSPLLTASQAALSVDGAISGFPTVLAGQCSIDPLTANVTTNGCEFR